MSQIIDRFRNAPLEARREAFHEVLADDGSSTSERIEFLTRMLPHETDPGLRADIERAMVELRQ